MGEVGASRDAREVVLLNRIQQFESHGQLSWRYWLRTGNLADSPHLLRQEFPFWLSIQQHWDSSKREERSSYYLLSINVYNQAVICGKPRSTASLKNYQLAPPMSFQATYAMSEISLNSRPPPGSFVCSSSSQCRRCLPGVRSSRISSSLLVSGPLCFLDRATHWPMLYGSSQ